MRLDFSLLSTCFYSIFFLTATLQTPAAQAQTETAIFAGGCFWCLQSDFDKVRGVLDTTVGYTGGDEIYPSYKQVSAGKTGHYEALRVVFNPHIVSYEELLTVFWRNIDPFDATGQFCDKGKQYRAAIFYLNDAQKKLAIASRDELEGRGMQNIVTQIIPAKKFYRAEKYHQEYYKKNPLRYKFYRYNCGRDKRLEAVWGEQK